MGWGDDPGLLLAVSPDWRAMMGAAFEVRDAVEACRVLGIDLESERFDTAALLAGMQVELEHGTRTPELDVTGDDPVLTAKIALAHLREIPDYYERLVRMEAIGEAAWAVSSDSDLGIV